jgi:hypothetical protein
LVIVRDPALQASPQMPLVQRNMKSKHSRRTVPISRSQYAFAFGARTGVRRTLSPNELLSSSSKSEKIESRSWISVVTAIVFFVRLQMYWSVHSQSAAAGRTWYDIPLNIRAPMYLNPFFFLTASFAPPRQLYPAWTTCAAVFIATGVLAVALTLRNLRRRSEL